MFGKRRDRETEGEAPKPRSRLRAWAKGFAIAGLVLVALAIAAGEWLVRSAREGRLTERLMLLGNRVLTQSSNLRFYAQRVQVRGGTFVFENLQVDAKEDGQWYRVLDAKRAIFSANLKSLALQRPQTFAIRVQSPVVHVVTAQNGHIVLPTFQSRAKTKGQGLKDGFHITLDETELRAHARGDSVLWWEHGTLDLGLRPNQGGFEIALDKRSEERRVGKECR